MSKKKKTTAKSKKKAEIKGDYKGYKVVGNTSKKGNTNYYTTPAPTILTFPQLFEPVENQHKQGAFYKLTLVIPKKNVALLDDVCGFLYTIIERKVRMPKDIEKTFSKITDGGLMSSIKDGDMTDVEALVGAYYMNLTMPDRSYLGNVQAPTIVDHRLLPVTEKKDCYAGSSVLISFGTDVFYSEANNIWAVKNVLAGVQVIEKKVYAKGEGQQRGDDSQPASDNLFSKMSPNKLKAVR